MGSVFFYDIWAFQGVTTEEFGLLGYDAVYSCRRLLHVRAEKSLSQDRRYLSQDSNRISPASKLIVSPLF